MSDPSWEPIVGIDLGTSNSAVAHVDAAGNAVVLADEANFKIHPSVVSFHPNGGVIVGAAAKQRKVIDPANTVFSVKRLLGRPWSSPEVQTAKARMPYQIKEGGSKMPMIVTRAGEFAVPEISAIVLDHLKMIAQARLDHEVHRAVITVPASFNDAQRSATATAGAVAGLTVERVLNEPTAAALAYGHTRGLHRLIAVYDFGGGTFDVTILKCEDEVYEVLGTAGDSFLGGDDLDERLVEKMVQKFLMESRIDLRTNEVSMMRLRAVAEQTKIELSRRSRAVVRIDEIAYGPKGAPLNLLIELTRDELISEIAPIIERTFPVCDEALSLANVPLDAIEDVILVGGTTKIPHVRDLVTRYFQKTPRTDIAAEEAVTIGAALQASVLERASGRGRRSSSPPAVPHPVDETVTGTTVADVTQIGGQQSLDSGLFEALTLDPATDPATDPAPPRRTNPYGATPGTRTVNEYAQHAAPRTTQPQAVPLARLTQRTPAAAAKTAPGINTLTLAGVPAAPTANEPSTISLLPEPPEPELDLLPAPPPRRTASVSVPPPPRITQASQAVPPPLPARATRPSAPPPLPTTTRPPSLGDLILGLDNDTVAASGSFDETQLGKTQLGIGDLPDATIPSAARTAPGFAAPVVVAPVPMAPRAAVPMVLDVTPRGLGIGTVAGFCEELIRRNARLPTETKKLFVTSRDQQDMVRIVVCQGESRRLDSNTVIGDLKLENLPPRPRGETRIEVTFQLDASGILQVRARDEKTGKEQRASLDLVGSMTEGEVSASRDRLAAMRR
ncbi:MAG: Hsp70 family protein [Proteobacteria bacterium]|nr:Hsp70 family protein [Pseudomonadota bacterium]